MAFDQTIYLSSISTGPGFGNATILPGPVEVSFGSISSEEAFGTPSVGQINLTGYGIESQERFSVPKIAATNPTPEVTPLLSSEFPAFVREDHPHFLAFMQAYYEWLEAQGGVLFQTKRVATYQDIDSTVDDYFEFFRKEFLVNIPSQISSPKDLVLKNIREYYRARGTEKSFRFFFRILLGLESSFYYPRVDMLRVSDGKWIQNKTLRVTITQGNGFDLIGRKIRGLNNNSSAFVENVQLVQEGFITVYELFLNRSSITGLFEAEETIQSTDGGIVGTISPIVVEIQITDAGEGYEAGQSVTITGVGTGATAKIVSVGTNGEVNKVEIKNYGAGYTSTPTVTFPVYPGVTAQAQGVAIVGGQTNYPGNYLNEDGHLDTTKFIQDSHYYQQFSYVVQVDETVSSYRDALKKALHPAGFIFFGTVASQNAVSAKSSVAGGSRGSSFLIIRMIQQFFKPFLEGQQLPANCTASPHSEIMIIHTLKEAENSYKLGPSYRSIERDKLGYKPNQTYDVDAEMAGGANANYWQPPNYANYQIKDFGHIIIKDMIDRPWTKTNIVPESKLRTSDLTGIPSEEDFGIPEVIV